MAAGPGLAPPEAPRPPLSPRPVRPPLTLPEPDPGRIDRTAQRARDALAGVRLGRPILAAAAVIVALLVVGVWALVTGLGQPSSATAAATPGPSPHTTPPLPTTAPPVPSPPPGMRLHGDPSGFRVAVPQEWEVSYAQHRTIFTGPDGVRLMIDRTPQPTGDPVRNWMRIEQSVQSTNRLPRYKRVALTRVRTPIGEAADWEFTYGRGTKYHVRDRGIIAADGQDYALYLRAPSSGWKSAERRWDEIADSFIPAT